MPGIHHVTAIAGDPVKNFDFYTRDLGLRFVKKTVNFDDPSPIISTMATRPAARHHPDLLPLGETLRPAGAASARPARPRSACRRARSATGRSASSKREFPIRRWRSALARPCCLSRIRTGWRSRSSASPAPRMSRAGAMATSRPSTRSAAFTA